MKRGTFISVLFHAVVLTALTPFFSVKSGGRGVTSFDVSISEKENSSEVKNGRIPVLPGRAETAESASGSSPSGSSLAQGANSATELRIQGDARPIYPLLARKHGEEGAATVSVRVAADGHVVNAVLTRSSGFVRLDEAGLEFFKKASFEPIAGLDHPIEKEFRVAFRLKEGSGQF